MAICKECSGCTNFFGRIVPGFGMVYDCAGECEFAIRAQLAMLRKEQEDVRNAEAKAAEDSLKKEIKNLCALTWSTWPSTRHESLGWKVETTTSEGKIVARHAKNGRVVISRGGILPPETLERMVQ